MYYTYDIHTDKILHFIVWLFLSLLILILLSYTTTKTYKQKITITIIILTIVSILKEVCDIFVPTRNVEIKDILYTISWGLPILISYYLFSYVRTKSNSYR